MFCTINSHYDIGTEGGDVAACYHTNFYTIGYNRRIAHILKDSFSRVVLDIRVSSGCSQAYYAEYISEFWNCMTRNNGAICCNPHSFEPGNTDIHGLKKPWYMDLKCHKEAVTTEDGWLRYV